jgi:hypothetical protein
VHHHATFARLLRLTIVIHEFLFCRSGPKRFDLSADQGEWLDTRDREPLHKILFAELEQLTGVSLSRGQ